MASEIKVLSTGIGTSDWQVTFADGRAIYDIHLDLEATLRGRYYILMDGAVRREGTFAAEAWDEDAIRELITAIVCRDYPEADVTVEVPRPRLQRTA